MPWRTHGPDQRHEVVTNVRLGAGIHRLEVCAPRVAEVAQPGQFVIVRAGPRAERIPLTIAGTDRDGGTITLVIQAVGKSTTDLVGMLPRSAIHDVAGPLGRPTELVAGGHAVCVGGGVGTAVVLPIARALHALGTRVTAVVGARSDAQLILETELRAVGPVVVCTDDGSRGRRGFVTDALAELLLDGADVVYAAGPVPMMRAVAGTTRPGGIRTIVSLNPIMVDGTGMCGGCRVRVGGEMRFACVDGPEFDAFDVDFDELSDRLTTYVAYEAAAVERANQAAS